MTDANKRLTKDIETRASSLLEKMSLRQKIGQMTQAERSTCSAEDVYQHHLGSILSAAGSHPGQNTLDDWLSMNDDYWHASMSTEGDNLGIPILYGVDAVHGNSSVKHAVVFPHNIGLGATYNLPLVKHVAKITAKEVLAAGVDWVFAPNLAVARDYHWGRTYESYSEDPAAVSEFAHAMVSGLQGNLINDGVLACIKHWVGDGGTLYGIDQGDTLLDWPQLRDIHVRPYIDAIDAGALSVMVSFSSWNGDKCHAHEHLISTVLKQDLAFSGFVISDMQGIDYLADDFYIATAQGVNAGIDMFMVPDNWRQFIENLVSHVELGTVPIERIDDAVLRILKVKFACGLFDKPMPSQRRFSNTDSFSSPEHRAIARECVQQSLVMLKNEHEILPLSKHLNLIVAGKSADNAGHQCGGFTVNWQGTLHNEELPNATTIWQGIAQTAPNAQLVNSAQLDALDTKNIDAAIVVIGETPYAEGVGDIRHDDTMVMELGRQINGQVCLQAAKGTSLELSQLYPEDLDVIRTLTDKGLPVITILVSGRPLIINQELELSHAFVAAWLPGSEGQGVSDVLFGDADFSGKLSFSWPKQSHPTVNIGDRYYNPKFPIGFGLRYTNHASLKSTG